MLIAHVARVFRTAPEFFRLVAACFGGLSTRLGRIVGRE